MFVHLSGVRRIMVAGEWWEVVLGKSELHNDMTLIFADGEEKKQLSFWSTITVSVEVGGRTPVLRIVRSDQIQAIELWKEEPK